MNGVDPLIEYTKPGLTAPEPLDKCVATILAASDDIDTLV